MNAVTRRRSRPTTASSSSSSAKAKASKKTTLKVDRLQNKKLVVGSFHLTPVRQIGEGGSAFIYLARRTTDAGAAAAFGAAGVPPLSTSATLSSNHQQLEMHDSTLGGHSSCHSTKSLSEYGDDDVADENDAAAGVQPTTRRRSRRSLLVKMGSSSSQRGGRRRSQRQQQRHHRNEEYVVLKATSVAGSSIRRRQAQVEVQTLHRLAGRHPNIVCLLDDSSGYGCGQFGSSPSQSRLHFTVLEHCPHGSLMDLISRQRSALLLLDDVNNNGKSRRRQQGGGDMYSPPTNEGGDNDDDSNDSSTNNNSGIFQKLHSFRGGSKSEAPIRQSSAAAPFTNERGYLDLSDILTIFHQIASAIDFLHSQYDGIDTTTTSSPSIPEQARTRRRIPVVHRDIKPENVLIARVPTITRGGTSAGSLAGSNGAEEWHVKLCDFGSAIEGIVPLNSVDERRAADEQIRTSTTPMYRAPEMVDLHSVSELTEKTDVWALGCTLYTTCFLQNCFEENSPLAILAGKYSPVPSHHPYNTNNEGENGQGGRIVDLIERMLQVDPTDRADMSEVCGCIEAMQKGRTVLPPRRPSSSSTSSSVGGGTTDDRRLSPPAAPALGKVDNVPAAAPARASKNKASDRKAATSSIAVGGGRRAAPPPPPPPPPPNKPPRGPTIQRGLHGDTATLVVRPPAAAALAAEGSSAGERETSSSSRKIGPNSAAAAPAARRSQRAKKHTKKADKSISKAKRCGASTTAATNSSSSFDHIYGDLEADCSWLKASSSSAAAAVEPAVARCPPNERRGDGTSSPPEGNAVDDDDRDGFLIPGRLFGSDAEWADFERAASSQGDDDDDALDRIKVFASEEGGGGRRQQCHGSSTADSFSWDDEETPPPLTELSSVTTASSEDLLCAAVIQMDSKRRSNSMMLRSRFRA